MSKIIIVESPSKSHTIGTYLGSDYEVLSSKGHIKELATKGHDGLGIDIENGFIPVYDIIPEKKSLVSDLIKKTKGKEVYLATDPDREGEAIAYHLAQVLNLDINANNRIEFHEITKKAVLEGLNNPHPINVKLVESQETRRMIDRILGFKLSKLLKNKIKSTSAGRVQSVALLLIVQLENEIKAFVPVKYYEMEAIINGITLKLIEFDGKKIDSKNRITDRSVLEDLKSRLLSFRVSNIETKEIRRQSKPTYTTSTLQQDASNKLNFSPTKTMRIAQTLYEGKKIGSEVLGLITYMRTDSTRLSNDFVKEANDCIIENCGIKYVGRTKVTEQKNMQDAHEGIRPTSACRKPELIKKYLTSDEFKLYSLIYNRTMASLMAPAIFNQTKIEFENNNSIWSTTGYELVFDGYLKVYGKDEEELAKPLPKFNLGYEFNASEINILDKETEPKSRYTEASLIKDMEELGIGRPSTYALTVETLLKRNYVELDKKSLVPTEQGILTTNSLQDYFKDVINVQYTANMEVALDKIASGEMTKIEEMNEFYDEFNPLFEYAKINMDKRYPIVTDEICPLCGNKLVIRYGKFGEFTACSNYPECNFIKKEEPESTDTGIICPNCGKGHIKSHINYKGRNKNQVFYACDNYPVCKTTYSDMPINEVCPNCGAIMLIDKEGKKYCSNKCYLQGKDQFICPNCGIGHLIPREATRGKNKGNIFYACNNLKCKTIINDEPTNEVCPNCGSMMIKDKNGNLHCFKDCNKNQALKTEDGIICPKCGVGHFVLRTASKGKNKGNNFYACSNFPKCKNILSVEEYNKLLK